MTDGLLDTNPFIHAHTQDRWSEECRLFLAALERGKVRVVLEPLITKNIRELEGQGATVPQPLPV